MSNYKENPWNELNPYSEGQHIYGRNQIIAKLTDAIYTNLQTVLYGKSGIGKTSLLQAGCFPELRKLHLFPIVIRPGIMEGSSDYVATIIDIIGKAAKGRISGIKPSFRTKAVGDGKFTENRLCQYLYSTQFVDDTNTPYIPVLIFDQFEEFLNNKKIFSRAVDFVKELYVLLDNTISIPPGFLDYSNYRLVFAIREDYLYCLEDIIDRYNLDELRYNRYRITALTDKQAQSVIEKTFRSSITDISMADLQSITNVIIPISKGQSEIADIRTPMLSLLGSLVFKQIIAGQGIGSINPSSTNNELYLYYDEIMSEPNIPLEVRWFLEQKLITVDGRRDSMDYQSALLTNQINEEQIEYLVKEKKILRIVEVGSGERRLEFSHDTICKALNPIIIMRDGFYKIGNELYFSSFDVEEKQPIMVKYLSFAAELGHLEAKQKLASLYEEKAKGTLEDQKFKSANSKRNRLITLLNGDEWAVKRPQPRKDNNNKYDVFLCYSRKDYVDEHNNVIPGNEVSKIKEALTKAKITYWFDEEAIFTGDVFVKIIGNAIKSSKIVLFVASVNSYSSLWNRKELEYAEQMNKTIFFVKIDDVLMPERWLLLFSDKGMIDFRYEAEKKKLFLELQKITSPDTRISVGSEILMINDYHINMIRVEGGSFTMGATLQQGGDNPDERIVHHVRLDSYFISQVPVTQELWEKVMGNNPSRNKGNVFPVENVSWNDCMLFIKRLNNMTGKEYRLPTEAEWEYAAKGGAKGRYNGYKYSGGNNLHGVSWNKENSDGHTHEVAQKTPNELGIYDMSGNVWEWCYDWYAPYSEKLVINPQGPDDGEKKVCRGGSWISKGRDCRISIRESEYPDERSADIGFRLAL